LAVDLMIAATAVVHGLSLYTLNAKDLRGLDELIEVVDVSA
jgi:predicted nucleic acid-binding protein